MRKATSGWNTSWQGRASGMTGGPANFSPGVPAPHEGAISVRGILAAIAVSAATATLYACIFGGFTAKAILPGGKMFKVSPRAEQRGDRKCHSTLRNPEQRKTCA